MRFILPLHNILLLSLNDIFSTNCQINILNDLQKYHLIGKPIFDKDIQKIIYHHLVFNICDKIIESENPDTIIVFSKTDQCVGDFTKFYSNEDITKFLLKFTQKIVKYLPIRIYTISSNFSNLCDSLNQNTGDSFLTANSIISFNNKFTDKLNTFEKIKKFTKKFGLIFLNQDYFENIKTKQILI